MRFTKHKFQMFGINLVLPIVVKIHQKINHDRADLLRRHKAEMAECTRCHRLIDAKAGTSFITHMQEHHRIEPDDSYVIVSAVWRNMLHTAQAGRQAQSAERSL